MSQQVLKNQRLQTRINHNYYLYNGYVELHNFPIIGLSRAT